MAKYTEPSKNKARLLLIRSAIEALTHKRHLSTLAKRNYVRCVKKQILKSNDISYKDGKLEASKLSKKTIKYWEKFYDSIVQTKKPENLKVAYLSGPNPENDLRVFVKHGILPENIWAFESDKKTYLKAVSSALASEFPFIKLVNSGIDVFFEASPQRFDIIYLDFCGPIPSRNNLCTRQK